MSNCWHVLKSKLRERVVGTILTKISTPFTPCFPFHYWKGSGRITKHHMCVWAGFSESRMWFLSRRYVITLKYLILLRYVGFQPVTFRKICSWDRDISNRTRNVSLTDLYYFEGSTDPKPSSLSYLGHSLRDTNRTFSHQGYTKLLFDKTTSPVWFHTRPLITSKDSVFDYSEKELCLKRQNLSLDVWIRT